MVSKTIRLDDDGGILMYGTKKHPATGEEVRFSVRMLPHTLTYTELVYYLTLIDKRIEEACEVPHKLPGILYNDRYFIPGTLHQWTDDEESDNEER